MKVELMSLLKGLESCWLVDGRARYAIFDDMYISVSYLSNIPPLQAAYFLIDDVDHGENHGCRDK